MISILEICGDHLPMSGRLFSYYINEYMELGVRGGSFPKKGQKNIILHDSSSGCEIWVVSATSTLDWRTTIFEPIMMRRLRKNGQYVVWIPTETETNCLIHKYKLHTLSIEWAVTKCLNKLKESINPMGSSELDPVIARLSYLTSIKMHPLFMLSRIENWFNRVVDAVLPTIIEGIPLTHRLDDIWEDQFDWLISSEYMDSITEDLCELWESQVFEDPDGVVFPVGEVPIPKIGGEFDRYTSAMAVAKERGSKPPVIDLSNSNMIDGIIKNTVPIYSPQSFEFTELAKTLIHFEPFIIKDVANITYDRYWYIRQLLRTFLDSIDVIEIEQVLLVNGADRKVDLIFPYKGVSARITFDLFSVARHIPVVYRYEENLGNNSDIHYYNKL